MTTTATRSSTTPKRRFGRRKDRTTVPADVSSALASQFSDHQIRTISRLGTMIDVDAGRTLMVEAQYGAEALVVVKGTAKVTRGGETVAAIGPGDIVGEGALLNNERRNADVVATSALSVVVMNPREFSSLLTQCPQLDARVRQIASMRSEAAAHDE